MEWSTIADPEGAASMKVNHGAVRALAFSLGHRGIEWKDVL
jgi:hypothetical protein